MLREFSQFGRWLVTALIVLALGVPAAVTAAEPALDLTAAEKAWLAEHPSIRLAVDIDWAPFEYIDARRNYVGMAAEYISLVEQRLGIEFEVEKEKTWSQAVEAMKQRELDMYSCVVSTVQRREYVDFTRPYLSFPMVIVTSDQVAYVNGVRDLRGEQVAVVEGYATQDLMEKNHPEIELYLARNVADALEQVSHGKVYAYIGNIATVSHVIKREGLTNIKISGETPYNYELSMAVRNDWPEFVPILQKALDSISEQQRDQIYRNWISLRYEHGFDYELFWQILGAVLLVLVTVVAWNRRLSSEIDKRIDAERLAQDAHQRLETANRKLVDYVDIVDRHVITSSTDKWGRITSASSAFREISGYSERELIGRSHSIVRHEDMPAALYRDMWQALTRGGSWEGEIKNRKKNGDYYWVQTYISPVFGDDGEITGYTAIREDITAKKLAEELSITDELTGMYNRRHFNELFPRELARAQRERRILGLMIMDVDYFKAYNDNYGHQHGDEALRNVAQTIRDHLRRAGDFAFRIGGEEFAVVVNSDDPADIGRAAENLRRAVEDAGFEHAYSNIAEHITVSIGLVRHDGRAATAGHELLFRRADDALYEAKRRGRNCVVEHDRLVEMKLAGES
ncbi:MAG: diguanylate cyclase [Gammaproteobacteria bacterium]|nr:diguanylate cyclase [Gammaproteobacteria bacterium]